MKTINYYTSDHTSIGSEKTGKFPHVLKFAFITIIAIVFSSCNDSEMAKQLNGSWDCDMEMKDDEGNPYTQNRTLTFNYLEDATGFGGNFTEKNITNLSGTEDDIELNCTVTSTINGKYEVIAGDLWLTYNLSSLDVSVSNVNYDLSDDADFFFRAQLSRKRFTQRNAWPGDSGQKRACQRNQTFLLSRIIS